MKTNYQAQYEEYQPESDYAKAAREVKRLKGFYVHFAVYVLVNILVFFINIRELKEGESYFKSENFYTAFFWGIGLTSHGVGVFGRNLFFGKKWEERKIQDLMNKEKYGKWE